MSHSNGQLFSFGGKELGWFEYNGTCDVCCCKVSLTQDLMHEGWRGSNVVAPCMDSTHDHVFCILYTTYGNGFHWLGKYCPKTMTIVYGIEPCPIDGQPFTQAKGTKTK